MLISIFTNTLTSKGEHIGATIKGNEAEFDNLWYPLNASRMNWKY